MHSPPTRRPRQTPTRSPRKRPLATNHRPTRHSPPLRSCLPRTKTRRNGPSPRPRRPPKPRRPPRKIPPSATHRPPRKPRRTPTRSPRKRPLATRHSPPTSRFLPSRAYRWSSASPSRPPDLQELALFLWCPPCCPRATGRALCRGFRTQHVDCVGTFRLAGAGKSTLKGIVSSWGVNAPTCLMCGRTSGRVWALGVRGQFAEAC